MRLLKNTLILVEATHNIRDFEVISFGRNLEVRLRGGAHLTLLLFSGVYEQMLRIDAMDLPQDSVETSSYQLGQCTQPKGSQHIYTGDRHFTPYATTVPTFIKRTSSSSTSEFRDIMGGASVNVLGTKASL